jgi:hypothetical protein
MAEKSPRKAMTIDLFHQLPFFWEEASVAIESCNLIKLRTVNIFVVLEQGLWWAFSNSCHICQLDPSFS